MSIEMHTVTHGSKLSNVGESIAMVRQNSVEPDTTTHKVLRGPVTDGTHLPLASRVGGRGR